MRRATRALALEEDHDAQRQAWTAKAAERAGFHRPADALKLVDSTGRATSGDADRAILALRERYPYLAAEEKVSQAELDRRHGAWHSPA